MLGSRIKNDHGATLVYGIVFHVLDKFSNVYSIDKRFNFNIVAYNKTEFVIFKRHEIAHL